MRASRQTYRFKLGRHTLSVGDPSQASEVGRDQIEKRFPLSRRLVEVRSCRLRPRRSGVQGFACNAQMTEDTGRARRRTGGPPFEDARPRLLLRSRGLARARDLSAIKVYGGPHISEFALTCIIARCADTPRVGRRSDSIIGLMRIGVHQRKSTAPQWLLWWTNS